MPDDDHDIDGLDNDGRDVDINADVDINTDGDINTDVDIGTDIDIENLSQIVRLGGTSPAVVDALDRLERLLGQHANALAEPDEARRALVAVREEAGRADRDDGRLAAALRRLAGRVIAVGALAEAVQQLSTQLRS